MWPFKKKAPSPPKPGVRKYPVPQAHVRAVMRLHDALMNSTEPGFLILKHDLWQYVYTAMPEVEALSGVTMSFAFGGTTATIVIETLPPEETL